MEDKMLNAWEYGQGTWKRIADPCDAAIDEEGGDVGAGLAKAGYTSSHYMGLPDGEGFAFTIYTGRRHSEPQPPYPYLIQTEIAGSIEAVYCLGLPDVLYVSNLCATSALASLLSEYEDVASFLTEKAREQMRKKRKA